MKLLCDKPVPYRSLGANNNKFHVKMYFAALIDSIFITLTQAPGFRVLGLGGWLVLRKYTF